MQNSVRRNSWIYSLAALILLASVLSAHLSAQEAGGQPLDMSNKLQMPISLDCVDLSIDLVIRSFADQARVNIIKGAQVKGTVTATLVDVPLQEALENVLAAQDLAYVVSDNMIRVVLAEQVAQKQQRLASKVFRITHTDVEEVAEALKEFKSVEGSISHSTGSSNIIVTDTQEKINAIDEFLLEIDRVTPQILVEVRIYDVTSTDNFDLGVDWEIGRNVPVKTKFHDKDSLRTSQTRSGTNVTTTTTTVTDTVDTVDPANTGTVTDVEAVTTQEPSTHGWVNEIENNTIETYTESRQKPWVGGSFNPEDGGVIRLALLNNAIDLQFALNMLHKQLGANLLANPSILVLDNETALFQSIREIPYTEQSETAMGGSMTSTEFKEVGVTLQVTPHVTGNGMLRLQIQPEFGVLVEQNANGAPTVDTRKLDTVALVHDGQYVVLGGLRKSEVTRDVRKVPLLGDIPLLGGLFRSESESVVNSELVVFIRPLIVTHPTLSPRELENLRKTNFPYPRMSSTVVAPQH